MNVSGKSLQDIYDAGSSRLEELEEAQKAGLSSTAEAHLEEKAVGEPESLQHLEERFKDLEVEIRSYLRHGIEKTEKVVQAEVSENEQHMARLLEGLVLLSRKFSEGINQLKDSTEFGLKDVSFDCEEQCRRRVERVTSELHKHGLSCLEALKGEGMTSLQGISDRVEQSLQSGEEQENEIKNRLFGAFVGYTGTVKTSLSDSLARLHEVFAGKSSELEGKGQGVAQEVQMYVERLLESAERQATESESRLKDGFSSMLQECNSSLDGAGDAVLSDLRGQYELASRELTGKSQQLGFEMDGLSEKVNQSVAFRDQEIRAQGDSLMDSFRGELKGRVETARSFQSDLEEERARMVEGIWTELTEVQSRFEEKLAQLAQSTLEQLQNICAEAETAICFAQEQCVSESKANAACRQDVIEAAARDFLDCVNQRREAALEGIVTAGGGGTAEGGPEGGSLAASPSGSKNKSDDRQKDGGALKQSKVSDQAPAENSKALSSDEQRKAKIARAIAELDAGDGLSSNPAERSEDSPEADCDDMESEEDASDAAAVESGAGANPRPGKPDPGDEDSPPRKRPGRKNSTGKSSSDKRSAGDGKR